MREEPFQAVGGIFNVRKGEGAPRERQPHQLHIRWHVVALRVAVHRNAAALHAAHARDQVYCRRQRASRVHRLRHLRDETARVHVAGQPAGWRHDRDAQLQQPPHKVSNEVRRTAGNRLGGHFPQPHRHRFDFLGGHSAVGGKTFIDRQPHQQLIESLSGIRRNHAPAHRGALASGHIEDIHAAHHLQDNVLNAPVGKLGFALLNEVGVFGNQAAIEHQRDAVPRGNRLDIF